MYSDAIQNDPNITGLPLPLKMSILINAYSIFEIKHTRLANSIL